METIIRKSQYADLVSVRCIDGWYHVFRLSRVAYVCQDRKICSIHVFGMEPLMVNMSLNEIRDLLFSDPCFVDINRSAFVNTLYVSMYEKHFVKLRFEDKEIKLPVTLKGFNRHIFEVN